MGLKEGEETVARMENKKKKTKIKIKKFESFFFSEHDISASSFNVLTYLFYINNLLLHISFEPKIDMVYE